MRRFLLVGLAGIALALAAGAGTAGSSYAQAVGGQVCSTTGFSSFSSVAQATCQVTASTQLTAPNTVLVVQNAFTGATPIACQGVSNPTYSTQGTISLPSGNVLSVAGGQTGCEFTVTSGFAPAGSLLGTETLNIPATTAGSVIQLNSFVCGDPSCASGPFNTFGTFGPPTPPTLVTISNANSCFNGSFSPNVCGNTAPLQFAGTNSAGDNNGNGPGHHHHHGDGDSDGDGN